jgi:hypothetical protein
MPRIIFAPWNATSDSLTVSTTSTPIDSPGASRIGNSLRELKRENSAGAGQSPSIASVAKTS